MCVQLCACVQLCKHTRVWQGVSSTAAGQCQGLRALALNRSGLCRGRDVPAGAHGTVHAQSSATFPADETGASPRQASTTLVKERVQRPETHPCLPCRRPERSPAPASLTRPPPTPLNLALLSPAVRARLAAKTSAAIHTPWRAAACLGGPRSPGKCPVLAPHGLRCPTPVVYALGKREGFERPKVLPGKLWQS